MDTITQLKAIAQEHELDNLDMILLQLEIMRNIQSPDVKKTLEKILTLAQIEPSVIRYFVEGFQKTSADYVAGGYASRGVSGLNEFIDKQEAELKNL